MISLAMQVQKYAALAAKSVNAIVLPLNLYLVEGGSFYGKVRPNGVTVNIPIEASYEQAVFYVIRCYVLTTLRLKGDWLPFARAKAHRRRVAGEVVLRAALHLMGEMAVTNQLRETLAEDLRLREVSELRLYVEQFYGSDLADSDLDDLLLERLLRSASPGGS